MSNPQKIRTVIGLFRVSTEEQAQEGNSLAAQQRMYEMDCRAFGWKSLGTHSGQETGTALDARAIIHEVIAELQKRRPDALWVREQSRLTRGDQLDVGLLLRELRESKTLVVTERGQVLDLNDIEGEFMFGLKALVDRREYQLIRRRSMVCKDEKARRGLLASGRPAYGYQTSGSGRDKGLRVPHPEESPVVQLIFELAATGRTIRQIIEELFARKLDPPTSRGRASGRSPLRFRDGRQLWAATTIKRMLRNPIYRGVSVRGCWSKKGKSFVFDRHAPNAICVEDAHEALVSQELWDAAQEQLKSRTVQRSVLRHMLSGILQCRQCGSPYRVDGNRDRSGVTRYYYVCGKKRLPQDTAGRRRRSGGACPSPYQRVTETDRLMWDALLRLISSPDLVLQYLKSGGAAARRDQLKAELADLDKRRKAAVRKVELARQKLLDEILTDGEYLTAKSQQEDEIRSIDGQAEKLRIELEGCSADAAERLLRSLALLRLAERKLSPEQRAALFRALVRRVTPQDDTLRVCEIELNAKVPPQLVEGEAVAAEACTRTVAQSC